MRLEFAERMRCPRPHAPTPLIIVASRSVERELVEGVAGCMICHLEARVTAGNVIFPGAQVPVAIDVSLAIPQQSAELAPVDPTALERLIALLGLAEPGGAVLLTGRYAELAASLAQQIDVTAIVLNAQATSGESVSAVRLAEPVVPFSDHTFRAVALDSDTALPVLVDAVRALQVGGRVLGALPLERPRGVRELARDATEWVGEREVGVGGIVRIERR